MNKQPFFTIGIPVYNTGKWVGECLDSILSQDFTDFEIICVDDGSTDNSLEILYKYAEKDSRIKIIHKENGGVSCARNVMHANANGRYFYAIDSDDIMCENVLPAIYKVIIDNNYPDIVQTGCKKDFNGQLFEGYYDYPGDEYFDPALTDDERATKLWLDAKFAPYGATRFIRKDIIWDNGLMFSQRYSAMEDSDFSVELYRKAKNIVYSKITSFVYMLRDSSVSASFSLRYFKSVILRWKDFYQEVESWNISDSLRESVKRREIEFYEYYRDFPLSAYNEISDYDTFIKSAEIIEIMLGNQITQLALPKGKNKAIFFLYKHIGISYTCRLLYKYLKIKGVIKE